MLLAFTPDRNVVKNDYRGAFKPGVDTLRRVYRGVADVEHVAVDVTRSPARMREQVLEALRSSERDVELVAFFCHGYVHRLQLGFSDRAGGGLPELAAAIQRAARGVRLDVRERAGGSANNILDTQPVVALYACTTGKLGDGGFADRLRDELCAAGAADPEARPSAVHCRVVAHPVAGHSWRLSHVRLFEGRGSSTGGTGGSWVVAPGSTLWSKWRAKMATSTLPLRFPLLTVAETHAELGG